MAAAFGKRIRDGGFQLPQFEISVPWHRDRWKMRGIVELAAAALVGFGVMLWIAAHWSDMPRAVRFAIVGGFVATSFAASLFARVRVPALIAAFLGTGGLFALIGQTYQTGADPWQLFAVWAAVTLPWALAARHDALWFAWSIVAATGLALWQATLAPSWWGISSVSTTAVSWASLSMLAAWLGPWPAIERWRGSSRWSLRLVVVLLLASIVQGGLADLFQSGNSGALYFAGLLLLVVLGALLLQAEQFDFALLALVAVAADVLLIGGVAKALVKISRDFMMPMLLLGLSAMAIVSATSAGLMSLARERLDGTASDLVSRLASWPLAMTSSIGAGIAMIPLLVFLALFIGPFMIVGGGSYVIGILLLVGASAVLRGSDQGSYVHHLASVTLMIGLGLVMFGLFRDSRGATAMASLLVALLATGLAFVVGRSWVTTALGALTAGMLAHSLAQAMGLALSPRPQNAALMPLLALPYYARALGLMIALAALYYGWRATWSEAASAAEREVADHIDRFVLGAVGASLLGTLSFVGPSLMIGGALGWRGGAMVNFSGFVPGWSSLSPLSALFAGTGCAWFLKSRPNFQTPLGYATALVVVALAAFVPSFGAPMLLFTVAATCGRRSLAAAAIATAIWCVGAYYYSLSWPLQTKALLMTTCGLALLAIAFLTREPASNDAADRPSQPVSTAATGALAYGLLALGAAAIAVLSTRSVASMEAILRDGRSVYLELAPVDPRSLVQGDYMALNFAIPRTVLTTQRPQAGQRLWATATLDSNRVAKLTALASEPIASTGDTLVLAFKAKGGRWIVGTDAWFFKEGTAKKWQAARYGEFRVAADGSALLVDLADKDLKSLK